VKQRIGVNKVDFQIEVTLKRYTRDCFMGGIDNVDKEKENGRSIYKERLVQGVVLNWIAWYF